MANPQVNCDTREATFACGYCGREVKYTISVVEVFKHLAIGCPRVPEERAWRIAGQLTRIEQVMCDFERATLAHLLKHPEDCGKTVDVVLGPSVGKDVGRRLVTTKGNASWLEWAKVKEK